MPHTYLFFGDIEGKLDVPRVECTQVRPQGALQRRLIQKHGRTGNLMKWREQLNGDCPKRDGRLNDRCDVVCADLPKVL
jgi:hypothetical protein